MSLYVTDPVKVSGEALVAVRAEDTEGDTVLLLFHFLHIPNTGAVKVRAAM